MEGSRSFIILEASHIVKDFEKAMEVRVAFWMGFLLALNGGNSFRLSVLRVVESRLLFALPLVLKR